MKETSKMKIPAPPAQGYYGLTLTQVRSAVRKEWMTWPKKFAAIQQRAQVITTADGRKRVMFQCDHCQALFLRSQVQVNHSIPVGPLRSINPADIADFRLRMFRPVAELEVVCKPCHQAHTKQQRRN